MSSTTSIIVGLAILGYIALAFKITAAIVIYRHKELHTGIRYALLFRYVVFFICFPIALLTMILPSPWHSTDVGLIAAAILVGVWLISIPVLQILAWRYRKNQQRTSAVSPPVANLSPKA